MERDADDGNEINIEVQYIGTPLYIEKICTGVSEAPSPSTYKDSRDYIPTGAVATSRRRHNSFRP